MAVSSIFNRPCLNVKLQLKSFFGTDPGANRQNDTTTEFPMIDLAFHLLKCGSLCCQDHAIGYRPVQWNVFFWEHAYFRA